MRRREFITLVAGAASWPLAARAQQPERMRRIGIVMPFAKGDSEGEARIRAFKQELAKLGWTDGGNIQFDERWTSDNMDLVRSHAASLMASNPDVVVAYGGRVVPVLMRQSRSIPIVVPGGTDPVGVGWVQSLARPGGNVTGFTGFELSMFGKALEILKQIAPAVARVALIYNPDNPNSAFYRRASEAASGSLAIEPMDVPIHGLADIDRAVASLSGGQNSGVFFLPDLTTNTLREEVVGLVARRRLPAMYMESFFVKIGGLASYGADRVDLLRRSAGYVDRILRGEKPSDLPFQQPTKYELMINLKAAKGLGLELSPAVLALAYEVIE
jgi:putative ABC transport system substrate-binding protein